MPPAKNGLFLLAVGLSKHCPDRVTVLAESAERRRDIDAARAQSSLERAQKRLSGLAAGVDVDFERAKAALQRALYRIRLIETKGH